MPDLHFVIEGAEQVPFAATPQLAFKLRVSTATNDEPVQSVALHCQLQFASLLRRYNPAEQEGLLDLFGEPAQWSRTLRTMLWTHADVNIPPFTGSRVVDLIVPCSFDFNVAATKYFAALEDGEVPLTFLFSGSVFYAAADGVLQITQIPWEKEAKFRLPVRVWRAMMDLYYPNTAWLCLRQDIFDRLYQYKVRGGLPTWEDAVEQLLRRVAEDVPV